MAVWQAAAVALAIGLLIGSERERSGHAGLEAGVRTFALAALAGCLASLAGLVVFAGVVVAAGAVAAVGHLRASERDPGLTTETALVLTVVLGGLAAHNAALAAAVGVAATVVLVSKQRMHHFVRDTVTDVEVTDALKFFVVAFVVLPLVPHAHLGPYGVVDPRRIWTLVVAVTALGWLGYLGVRVLGPGRGLPVAGLAGGFVSATVTTAAMARQARTPGLGWAGLAAALLASVATLVQLVVVTAVADRRVAALLAPAAVVGAVLLCCEAGVLMWAGRRARRRETSGDRTAEAPAPAAAGGPEADPSPPSPRPVGRPFALVPALVLVAVLTLFLVLASVAEHRLGVRGSVVAIALAGLADAHAGALAAASLAASRQLAVPAAAIAAMTAVGVNTLVKFVAAAVAGGRRFAVRFALLLALPIVGVVVTLATTLTIAR